MDCHENSILILDDDADDTYLVCDAIEEIADTSYRLTVSHCPKEAADLLRNETFDLVLCDYMMGAISGIDFIKSMRNEGIEVPFILLTGMGDMSTDKAALAAGASDFLSKVNLTSEVIDRAIRYSIANFRRHRLFQTILNNVNAAVVLLNNENRPVLWNPEFVEMAEYYSEGTDGVEEFAEAMMSCDRIVTIRSRVLEKRVSATPEDGTVVILHDITEHMEALREREAAKNHAAHLARYCSLTGLPNRISFSEKINDVIATAETEGGEFYLLNLDLNKFKDVNDVYGHSVGDRLLIEVSNLMAKCCNDSDYIARLGGDEFMAIQFKSPNCEEIPDLARRIVQEVNSGVFLEDLLFQSGVSIGISHFPKHGRSAEMLMSNADIAMYRAKADPNNRIYAYNEILDKQVRETRQIGQDLRRAIENDQLDVYFQPQANMRTNEITGFEALARWNHPDMGPIEPSVFIPIAEENGLITKLGEVVMRRACKFARDWPRMVKLALNISPVQIRHSDLVQLVRQILEETRFPAENLELEITESALIEDKEQALKVLSEIKELGISVALDDFGTGYSSLSTLISFPFDKIKIDKSFTAQITRSQPASVVTNTIVRLAGDLNFSVIAEGVESPKQIAMLMKYGCLEMQGYMIGKPKKKAEVIDLLSGDGGWLNVPNDVIANYAA